MVRAPMLYFRSMDGTKAANHKVKARVLITGHLHLFNHALGIFPSNLLCIRRSCNVLKPTRIRCSCA